MSLDPDLALVIGVVLAAFSIPSIMSAFADNRAPRASTLLVVVAGGLILFALRTRPGGYGWTDIPEAFVRIVAERVRLGGPIRTAPGAMLAAVAEIMCKPRGEGD